MEASRELEKRNVEYTETLAVVGAVTIAGLFLHYLRSRDREFKGVIERNTIALESVAKSNGAITETTHICHSIQDESKECNRELVSVLSKLNDSALIKGKAS